MQRTTQRLLLQAATIDLAQAELTSLEVFGALINATIPSGWPPGEYDRSAQESFLERLRQGSNQVVGWYSWYAIHTNGASRTLIGAGGFIGPPDDSGFVEIGFSILPDWYGRGFATEMAVELIAFAFEHDRVRGIIGNTTRSNVASCRVFSHLGFVETESDPNREEVRFVLTKASAPA
jgi:[ribosomal protein S5]-alanine N-acetyltransferase